jgi:phosphoribosylformylglycinamidine synthase subunit PurL
VTDNLNFGNPYKPENFWQLREAVEGIAETCRAFGTPVVGGNVSLYNESPAGVVDPTPTVAMVGLIEKEEHITTQYLKAEGDVIILVGQIGDEMGGSRFLKVCHGRKEGRPPRLDVERELAVQNSVRELIRAGLVRSAHDCSEGGLAVAIAESCFNPNGLLGAEISVSDAVHPPSHSSGAAGRAAATVLFNESQSRIVISCAPNNAEKISGTLTSKNIPHQKLGEVTRDTLAIKLPDAEFSWPIETLYDDWFNAIRRAVESDAEPVRSL